MLDNSLPNMKIQPITNYQLPITSYHLASGTSTLVESALQIHPFLTNKANFKKSQMNVTDLMTRRYVQMDTWSIRKNKANSKPIQTQYKPNSNPIQTQCLSTTPFGRLAHHQCVGTKAKKCLFYKCFIKNRKIGKHFQCSFFRSKTYILRSSRIQRARHEGRPFPVDCPFASGLTEQGMLVIVWSAMCIAEWINLFDVVFSDLRQ